MKPDEPTVTWYSLMSSMPSRVFSTFFAAASAASRLVPGANSCLTVSTSCSPWSKKLVLSSGAMPRVTSRTTNARTTLVIRRRVAKPSTLTYARCIRLLDSFSSAIRRASAGSIPRTAFGARRNQYESTGTTVSETSSDASRAAVIVSENEPNSSPTMPPTRPIGRNTATVVSVDAVTAPATSLTAEVIANSRSSP